MQKALFKKTILKQSSWSIILLMLFSSCSNSSTKKENFKTISTPIDTIRIGEKLFLQNCAACHNLMSDSLSIFEIKKDKYTIKKILSDTVTHNGLSYLTTEEIELISKYLSQGPQY